MQTFLDEWTISKGRAVKENKRIYKESRPARFIRIKAAGFPMRDAINYPISVTDDRLFEVYARDQWIGTTVGIGDYLFDQRIIPDFAFEIIKVLPPGKVTITEDTVVRLEMHFEQPKHPWYTFGDIVGHNEVKKKCKVIIRYLKNPKIFGEWAPRNILFYGPPGTGKTMTARTLAGETKSSLHLVRATDLIGEYVGDGAKRIHDLFKTASSSAPAVVFIDELDAIGLDRSYQAVRGDVAEIVNALLTELEGLYENTGIVTIAATNNPSMLDKALRSRFEEEMEFALPNGEERLRILKNYSKRLPIKMSANLKDYKKKTKGFSGRDLKDKLLKAALHKAILEDAKEITKKHLELAFKAIPQRPSPPKEMFS
ncbi:MAG: AAA family ATPase [Candidatus Hydrothermarchaeaceae archaeon]